MENKSKILTAIAAATTALLLGYGIYKYSQITSKEVEDEDVKLIYEDLKELGVVNVNS